TLILHSSHQMVDASYSLQQPPCTQIRTSHLHPQPLTPPPHSQTSVFNDWTLGHPLTTHTHTPPHTQTRTSPPHPQPLTPPPHSQTSVFNDWTLGHPLTTHTHTHTHTH